jgi:hypothetical protein
MIEGIEVRGRDNLSWLISPVSPPVTQGGRRLDRFNWLLVDMIEGLKKYPSYFIILGLD